MSNEFEDGFSFGSEDEVEVPKKPVKKPVPRQKTQESGNTASADINVHNAVNRKGRQAQPTSGKSNALPDPNKVVVPPTPRNEQGGTGKTEPDPMFTSSDVDMTAQAEHPVKETGKKKAKKRKAPKEPKQKGKKKKLPIVIGTVGVIAVLGVGGVVASKVLVPVPMEQNYETSGRKVYDTLVNAINNYDAKTLDSLIGSDTGDSYLAQEWSYANNNQVREDFIKKVCSMVQFSYPLEEQLSTKGKIMTDKSGNAIMVESYMNSGEKVIITLPDYKKIAEQMQKEKETIEEMGILEDIKKTDYDYQDKCFDLMLTYIVSMDEIPTTNKEVLIPLSGGAIKDDINLDNILFASDAYHDMCDEFDKIMTGFTGITTEKYTEKEEVHNPEYDEWYKIFKERYDEDKGVFDKNTSLWEPWYVYNEKNEVQLDENGNKKVRYYSVKDANGNDWIQPSKTIWQDVEKEREVPVEYVPEQAVPYCFLGAYYAQNNYEGDVSSDVRVGDGSIEYPAGVGTPIITHVKGTDGKYHDIKVTLKGYWVGEDAIDYAVSFSEKNRGFDPKSPVQLICYEVEVENLETKDFTFDSEMMLCDKSSSRTGRTGTMYGFNYENVTVKAKDKVIFNDWATSTEIDQKYVAWGKSFNREYETVFFKVLAGTGKTPSYSAYEAFTGESSLEEDKALDEEVNGETTDTSNTDSSSTDTSKDGNTNSISKDSNSKDSSTDEEAEE